MDLDMQDADAQHLPDIMDYAMDTELGVSAAVQAVLHLHLVLDTSVLCNPQGLGLLKKLQAGYAPKTSAHTRAAGGTHSRLVVSAVVPKKVLMELDGLKNATDRGNVWRYARKAFELLLNGFRAKDGFLALQSRAEFVAANGEAGDPNPTTDASVVHCATYMASSFKTSSAPEAAQSQAGGSAGKHEEGSMDVVMEGEGVAQPGGEGADGVPRVVRNVVVLTNDNGMCILAEASDVCAGRTQDLPYYDAAEALENCVWAMAESGRLPEVVEGKAPPQAHHPLPSAAAPASTPQAAPHNTQSNNAHNAQSNSSSHINGRPPPPPPSSASASATTAAVRENVNGSGNGNASKQMGGSGSNGGQGQQAQGGSNSKEKNDPWEAAVGARDVTAAATEGPSPERPLPCLRALQSRWADEDESSEDEAQMTDVHDQPGDSGQMEVDGWEEGLQEAAMREGVDLDAQPQHTQHTQQQQGHSSSSVHSERWESGGGRVSGLTMANLQGQQRQLSGGVTSSTGAGRTDVGMTSEAGGGGGWDHELEKVKVTEKAKMPGNAAPVPEHVVSFLTQGQPQKPELLSQAAEQAAETARLEQQERQGAAGARTMSGARLPGYNSSCYDESDDDYGGKPPSATKSSKAAPASKASSQGRAPVPAPRSNPKTSVYDDLLNQGSDEEYGGPPVKARGPAVHIGRGGRAAPATKPTLPTTGTDAYLEAAFGVDSAAGTSSAQRYGGSSNRKAGSVPFGGPPAPSPAAAPVPAAEGPPRRWWQKPEELVAETSDLKVPVFAKRGNPAIGTGAAAVAAKAGAAAPAAHRGTIAPPVAPKPTHAAPRTPHKFSYMYDATSDDDYGKPSRPPPARRAPDHLPPAAAAASTQHSHAPVAASSTFGHTAPASTFGHAPANTNGHAPTTPQHKRSSSRGGRSHAGSVGSGGVREQNLDDYDSDDYGSGPPRAKQQQPRTVYKPVAACSSHDDRGGSRRPSSEFGFGPEPYTTTSSTSRTASVVASKTAASPGQAAVASAALKKALGKTAGHSTAAVTPPSAAHIPTASHAPAPSHTTPTSTTTRTPAAAAPAPSSAPVAALNATAATNTSKAPPAVAAPPVPVAAQAPVVSAAPHTSTAAAVASPRGPMKCVLSEIQKQRASLEAQLAALQKAQDLLTFSTAASQAVEGDKEALLGQLQDNTAQQQQALQDQQQTVQEAELGSRDWE